MNYMFVFSIIFAFIHSTKPLYKKYLHSLKNKAIIAKIRKEESQIYNKHHLNNYTIITSLIFILTIIPECLFLCSIIHIRKYAIPTYIILLTYIEQLLVPINKIPTFKTKEGRKKYMDLTKQPFQIDKKILCIYIIQTLYFIYMAFSLYNN